MMRKKKSQMLPIIQAVLCSHKTFTFSNSLVIIHSQAKLFLKLTRDCSLIKDWHFLRCVVSSNTFACICWLDVGFSEAPLTIHVFFYEKETLQGLQSPFYWERFSLFCNNGSLLPKRCLAVWCSGAGSLRRLLSKREPREGVHRRSQTKAQQVLVSDDDVPNNV